MYLPYCTNNINCVINIREHRRGQSKIDNPEKMATQGTEDEKKKKKTTQHNICWTPLYANKHKYRK